MTHPHPYQFPIGGEERCAEVIWRPRPVGKKLIRLTKEKLAAECELAAVVGNTRYSADNRSFQDFYQA
jgi:hypothetical protein